jgi:hypothetical protein
VLAVRRWGGEQPLQPQGVHAFGGRRRMRVGVEGICRCVSLLS